MNGFSYFVLLSGILNCNRCLQFINARGIFNEVFTKLKCLCVLISVSNRKCKTLEIFISNIALDRLGNIHVSGDDFSVEESTKIKSVASYRDPIISRIHFSVFEVLYQVILIISACRNGLNLKGYVSIIICRCIKAYIDISH